MGGALSSRAQMLISLVDMDKLEYNGFTVSHVASRLGVSEDEAFRDLCSLQQSGFLYSSMVAMPEPWIYEQFFYLSHTAGAEVQRLGFALGSRRYIYRLH